MKRALGNFAAHGIARNQVLQHIFHTPTLIAMRNKVVSST